MSVEKAQCSFCDRWTDEVAYMVEASPLVHICSFCIEEYGNPPSQSIVSHDEAMNCSFCGKPAHAVEVLMQGYSEASICNACVDIARQVMEENT